jgi:hypothetical protein
MAAEGLMGAWVGKAVQVLVKGDSDPWVALLEGWDGRGVVLRYTEQDARLAESRGEEPLEPMLMLIPWAEVRYVSVAAEDVEPA